MVLGCVFHSGNRALFMALSTCSSRLHRRLSRALCGRLPAVQHLRGATNGTDACWRRSLPTKRSTPECRKRSRCARSRSRLLSSPKDWPSLGVEGSSANAHRRHSSMRKREHRWSRSCGEGPRKGEKAIEESINRTQAARDGGSRGVPATRDRGLLETHASTSQPCHSRWSVSLVLSGRGLAPAHRVGRLTESDLERRRSRERNSCDGSRDYVRDRERPRWVSWR